MNPNVDAIAQHLAYAGRLARAMPPAWDGAAISHLYAGPGGEYLGRILPGRGLYLAHDLNRLGITRPIQHVYEPSPVQRLMDQYAQALHREGVGVYDPAKHADIVRATITTYDGIIQGRAGGKANDIVIAKLSQSSITASNWTDFFRISGGFPAAGTYNSTTAPTGATANRVTTGAWSLGLANPTAPDKKYILTLGITLANLLHMAILIDLLAQSGAFRLTVTTTETVASPPALTRYTDGKGVQMVFVATTATSATGHVLTIEYTDQDGNTLQSVTVTAAATAVAAHQVYPAIGSAAGNPFTNLLSGDYGVREIKSTDSNTALAAGVLAGLLVFPLAFVPGVAANIYAERDSTVQIDGLTELTTEAGGELGCLSMLGMASASSTGLMAGFIRTVAG